ncbi:MAG: OmpA family protein [Halorhodospira halophila]|uniref:flagellar motor protein MotB n=1 Tax=Halorhodospira TaxID=85108 RepID=UPI001EE8DF51|nr:MULTISPECIES: flagellar motor protein MotB [Halorhodospira]MCC3751494.1 OmpA family protein [Halorhodospira halophila]MCG5533036.1 OmpA family protein [Halorhodospira sp. 9621]MCG5538188.1 OmpA family protein [Halorhodospira sp. 9622]
MVEENKTRPVVIKKVAKHGEEHHGGSWKIAFADFMTAMFAIFLVLWLLLALDDDQRKGIGQYFRDPQAAHPPAARDVIDFEGERRAPIDLEGMPLGEGGFIRAEEMQDLAERFQDAVMDDPDLAEYADQIMLDITDDGLRIQLVDHDGRPMFELGSADPKDHTEEILRALAGVLEEVPNPVSLSGHTDARPFARDDYDNWSLSTDRAHSARQTLVDGGLPAGRIGQVVGYADTIPADPDDPRADINRRISVVLLSRAAVASIAERERRMDPDEHALDALPRRPRELLTPEERRIEQGLDDVDETVPEVDEDEAAEADGEAEEAPDDDGEEAGPEVEMPDLEPPAEPETW